MNFLAHAEVARRLPGSSDDVVLGAMLPDVAPMVSLHLERHRLAPALAAGWASHVAADRVFHGDARFSTAVAEVAAALRNDGWERWPARAAAHAGWELLLDGCLARRSDPSAWFVSTLDSPALAGALTAEEARRWQRLVEHQRVLPLWRSYLDIGDLAERVWGRLSRTRLAFDRADTGRLAAALEERTDEVEELAEPLVVAAVVACGPGGEPG